MEQLVDISHFVGRQQPGMVFVDAQLLCHLLPHLFAVAGEHHGAAHANRLQVAHGLGAVVPHFVLDDDVAGIFPVDGNMDDGADMAAIMPLHPDGIHHFGIADANRHAFHFGANAVSSNLFHVAQLAAVGGLVGEGVAKGGSNGMGGIMLDVGGKMQQMPLVALLGMHGSDGELTLRERARLVEHHRVDLRQHIHVVGAFHEDAFTRCASDAAKKSEWHTDDQGARARNHKEHQGTIEPSGK